MQPGQVDLDYELDHVITDNLLPDLDFLFRRMSEATVRTVAETPPGLVLDVGSGASRELLRLSELGWQAVAVDPSPHMLGMARLAGAEVAHVHLVRAIGERLPFADGTFDAVISQAALDHFADPAAFMAEAARVLRPTGRVVILLHNFGGLTTRLGKLLHPLARVTRLHHCADWPCWEIPPDHTFKGEWRTVRALGGPWLRLERAYGISLLCMFYGWGRLLRRLPDAVAQRLLHALDRLAYGRPAWSDVIVSVWRPKSAQRSDAS